jgi:soluble lytic murein transglycosylase
VFARLVASTVCLYVSMGAVTATAAAQGYWYDPGPQTPEESALVAALSSSFTAGLDGRIGALAAFASQNGGTAAAGLARLEIGLQLLAAGRTEEAATALQHPDLARTGLTDEALYALGNARQALGDVPGAVKAYTAAARAAPRSAVACPAALGGLALAQPAPDDLVAALAGSLDLCAERTAEAELALGMAYDSRGQWIDAVQAYERVAREYPLAPEADAARTRRALLAGRVPPPPPEIAFGDEMARARALIDARRGREAVPLLQQLRLRFRGAPQAIAATVRLGEVFVRLNRAHDALKILNTIPVTAPEAAEAAYWRARATRREGDRLLAYETVASAYATTPWAERSLLALARHYQKSGRLDDADPYYRRLLSEFPEGEHAQEAAFRVAWVDYRHGRYSSAATSMEDAAAQWSDGNDTATLLYWAGRAYYNMGQIWRARLLWTRTMVRYKNTYHGMLAEDALSRLPPPGPNEPPPIEPPPPGPAPPAPLPEPLATRVRQYLLLDRRDEALRELRTLPDSRMARATIAWLEAREGNLRTAITMMKRAYPEHRGAAGDTLPREVWQILYPLRFREGIESAAAVETLDPALVAGLICQESTFEPEARSRAGARGLMQIMPSTGRQIARAKGVRHRTRDLTLPEVSLDFGTHYLARMVERFDGKIERALAAYNAGPQRVAQWTAGDPGISAQEFIESIPFSETRHYVQIVVTNEVHYRRIYGLVPQARRSRNELAP